MSIIRQKNLLNIVLYKYIKPIHTEILVIFVNTYEFVSLRLCNASQTYQEQF